jgi:hypothetical protein
MNDAPSIYEIELTFAMTNAGARAGLLESVAIESVKALGDPEVATGATPPRYDADRRVPAITEPGVGPVALPRTVEAGDVRSFQLKFELAGAFQTAANRNHRSRRTGGRSRNCSPISNAWRSRSEGATGAGWACSRAGRTTESGKQLVKIPACRFREPVALLWAGEGRDDLVELARGSA